MVMRAEDLDGLLRGQAFRHLLAAGVPVTVEDLGASIDLSVDKVTRVLEELGTSGRIRRNEAGQVVGSAGLSVVADRHEMDLEGRRFWTWCAYDILGIFGALGATGSAVSYSPSTGAPITLHFRDGRPDAAGVVLFRPSDSLAASCTNIYEEWCPNSNFFEEAESARAWSTSRGLEGRILSLHEASDLATAEWLPVTRAPGWKAE
jgi:alkylmercury lyase